MSTAPATPSTADHDDKRVDAMVADAAARADAADAVASSVDAAVQASPANLDEQLSAQAKTTIDDDFADPADLGIASASPAPAPPSSAEPVVQPEVAKPAPPAEPPVAATPVITPSKPAASAPQAATKPARPAAPAAAATSTTASATKAGALGTAVAGGLTRASSLAEPIALRLGKLSPSARQTIGWAALFTLFHAVIVWAYVLLKSPPDAGKPHGAQPTLRDKPAAAAEEKGEHGGHDEAPAASGGHAEPAQPAESSHGGH